MAKSDVRQAFNSLKQFLLNDVTPTGRILGTGSYGSVEEVSYKHLVCAGKKLHKTLIDVENEGVAEVVQKYVQECQLMSSLRHPNITQFLGLCFLPGTQLPVLVMERLETSLDDLLEHMPNIPLSFKRSILEDVACGLVYLHNREPPVIHRDLTSKNVLLTSCMVAKITDMGNSRIVTTRPGQMARTLTKYPGTLVYMPPEAQDDIHRYGATMDVFSFGHLALYVLTQIFPGDLLPSTYPNPDNPHEVRGRSEVERRERYISLLKSQFSANYPILLELVKQCLHNDPRERPSTEQLLTRLQGVKEDIQGVGRNVLRLDLAKLKMIKEFKLKDKKIEELLQQQSALEDELKKCTEKTRQESEKKLQATKKNDLASKDVEIATRDAQLKEKDGIIGKLQSETRLKDQEIRKKKATLEECQMREGRLIRAHTTTLKAYLSKWETKRHSILLTKQLAMDEDFVNRWEGKWKGTAVMVKRIEKVSGCGGLTEAEFLQDAVMMARLEHPNIVQLLAVSWNGSLPYVIREATKAKNLRDYLKNEGRSLKLPKLVSMCEQIASGMEFMESQNYIHGNLAARNISVTESLTCKVGNFYFSRASDHNYHVGILKGYTFRWSPPEVQQNQFTSKFDVWSFGITLYEVITHGQPPYPDFEVFSEIIPKVLQGYRMPKPRDCPDKLYKMMLDCWQLKPKDRPTFKALRSQLVDFFAADSKRSQKGKVEAVKEKEVTAALKDEEKDKDLTDKDSLGEEKEKCLKEMNTMIAATKVQLERCGRTLTALLNITLSKWGVDHLQVKLIRKRSTGNIATLWEGTWKDTTQVTVKVHQKPGELSPAEFLQDAVVMSHLRHPNLLQLLAVCRKSSQPSYIITELVKPESLLDYLQGNGKSLQQPRLINMCWQIASGMAHMESLGFVHRDLTARNILLTENLTCKVSNFFFADVIGEGTYRDLDGTKYPVKWTPPEVFFTTQFNRKNDVWSFGIVLYEIITYGQMPYPGMNNSVALQKLKEGYRMLRPQGCPLKLYEMMMTCWEDKPQNRPTFQTLQAQLEKYYSADKLSVDTTKKQESTTKKQESTTKKQESTTKMQESATKKQESATKKQESATKMQESATKMQESATKKQESATKMQESAKKMQESATKKQESATKMQESATKKQESATKKQESTTKKQEVGKAQFDIAAENADELSFNMGDIITNIEKTTEKKGWWRGTRQLDGSRGLFPYNYIRLT